MNSFLQSNSFVRNTLTWQKTALVKENNRLKEESKVVKKDFFYEILHYIAEANGSQIFKSCGNVNLGVTRIRVSQS